VPRQLGRSGRARQFAGPIANGIATSMGYASLGAWILGQPKSRGRIAKRSLSPAISLSSGRRPNVRKLSAPWFREPQRARMRPSKRWLFLNSMAFRSPEIARIILAGRERNLQPGGGSRPHPPSMAASPDGARAEQPMHAPFCELSARWEIEAALITLDERASEPEDGLFGPIEWRGELRIRIAHNDRRRLTFARRSHSHRHEAKGMELRATTSLARLSQSKVARRAPRDPPTSYTMVHQGRRLRRPQGIA